MPRTPKAGSSFVASTMGVGVGEDVEFEDAVDVGVGVMVRLNTVGSTVVRGMFWPADRVTVVTVTLLVVSTSETGWELASKGAKDEDCADTGSSKENPASTVKEITARASDVDDQNNIILKAGKTGE
jgi:hypothetical protein